MPEEQKKMNKKKIYIIIAVAAVAVIGGIVLFFVLSGEKESSTNTNKVSTNTNTTKNSNKNLNANTNTSVIDEETKDWATFSQYGISIKYFPDWEAIEYIQGPISFEGNTSSSTIYLLPEGAGKPEKIDVLPGIFITYAKYAYNEHLIKEKEKYDLNGFEVTKGKLHLAHGDVEKEYTVNYVPYEEGYIMIYWFSDFPNDNYEKILSTFNFSEEGQKAYEMGDFSGEISGWHLLEEKSVGLKLRYPAEDNITPKIEMYDGFDFTFNNEKRGDSISLLNSKKNYSDAKTVEDVVANLRNDLKGNSGISFDDLEEVAVEKGKAFIQKLPFGGSSRSAYLVNSSSYYTLNVSNTTTLNRGRDLFDRFISFFEFTEIDTSVLIPPDRCQYYSFQATQKEGEYPYDYMIVGVDIEWNRYVTVVPSMAFKDYSPAGMSLVTTKGTNTPGGKCESLIFAGGYQGFNNSYQGIYRYDLKDGKITVVDNDFNGINNNSAGMYIGLAGDNYLFKSNTLGLAYTLNDSSTFAYHYDRSFLYYVDFLTKERKLLKVLPLNYTFTANNNLSWEKQDEVVKIGTLHKVNNNLKDIDSVNYQTYSIYSEDASVLYPEKDWVFHSNRKYQMYFPDDWVIKYLDTEKNINDETYMSHATVKYAKKGGTANDSFQIKACPRTSDYCRARSMTEWLESSERTIANFKREILGFMTYDRYEIKEDTKNYYYVAQDEHYFYEVKMPKDGSDEVAEILTTYRTYY